MSKKRREKTKAKQQRHKPENVATKQESTLNKHVNTASIQKNPIKKNEGAAASQVAQPTKQVKTTRTATPKPSSTPAQLMVNPDLKHAAPEWKAFYSRLSESMNEYTAR